MAVWWSSTQRLWSKNRAGATISTLPTTPSGSVWKVRLLRDLEKRVNADGSLTVAFEVSADTAEEASTRAFSAFGTAISAAATRYTSERQLAAAQAAIVAAGHSAAGAVGSLRVGHGHQPVSA